MWRADSRVGWRESAAIAEERLATEVLAGGVTGAGMVDLM